VPATLANSTVSGRSGGSSVLVVLVDVVGVVVVLAPVVVVGGSDVVLDVVVVEPTTSVSITVAGRLAAPGPGRLAAALMMPFAVPGTQKVAASSIGWATPGVSAPAGKPSTLIERQVGWPKHPSLLLVVV
jgi:hypothetical protein